MNSKKLLIIFYLIAILFLTFSQTNKIPDSTGDPVKDTTSDWKVLSEQYKLKSLAKDIFNADYNQLKQMALALNIKAEDNANAYRTALKDYYKVTLITPEVKKGDIIILERAGEMKMFKITEDDEENLHLIGKVRIIIKSASKSNNKNDTGDKTIEADEIFIDLKNKEISGIGNIIFKDNNLEFNGEQFYYNFEINKGMLLKGRTKILKSGDSGLKDAVFSGEKIIKYENDDSILYNGDISTCNIENPHYFIKVTRIWLSQKGEWGLLNGIVYLGATPFFYLPIYYHPKDLIIHPVFGYRSREGWYLNTTYFALGDKAEDKNQVTGIDKNRNNPVIDKSFIHVEKATVIKFLDKIYDNTNFYIKNPLFKLYPHYDSFDIGLRAFADAYTNLGFYSGGYFYFNKIDKNYPFKISILSDFGLSRLLWQKQDSDTWLYYNPSDKNKSPSEKINTYYDLSDNPLEMRTSQWVKMIGDVKTQFINFNYDSQLEYVTDNAYFDDFYKRKINFSYIDLLSDTLKYSIDSQDKKMSNFVSGTTTSINLPDNQIKTYLNLKLNSTTFPTIFDLPLISSFDFVTNSDIVLAKENIPFYKPTSDNGMVNNPKYNRFMLHSFSSPNDRSYLQIKGTIIDYKIYQLFPVKYNDYINTTKDKKTLNNLYYYIDQIKKNDTTKDNQILDYKYLLPFYSSQVNKIKKDSTEIISRFNNVYNDYQDDYIIKQDNSNDIAQQKYEKVNYYIPQVELLEKISNPLTLKIADFNYGYDFKVSYYNKFNFKTDLTSDKPEYDSTQQLFNNQYLKMTTIYDEVFNKHYELLEINKILESFHIREETQFNFSGYNKFILFNDKPLFQDKPSFIVSSIMEWDYLDYFEKNQLYNNAAFDSNGNIITINRSNINKNISDKNEFNRKNTNLDISFTDTLVNNLSFGYYRFDGTGITTNIKVNIFKYNLLRSVNIYDLNDINQYDIDYQRVDPTYYYSDRVTYERVEDFNSKFIFKYNFFKSEYSHNLSMSLGPTINWMIPKKYLLKMKDNLWMDQSSDVTYQNIPGRNINVIDEAKDYIYYRLVKQEGKPNLMTKINEFFYQDKFFYGPQNYRKMLEDVTYNISYLYKPKTIEIIKISNDFILKFENMGYFSKGNLTIDDSGYSSAKNGNISPYSIYPDDKLNINFFNSIFTYSFNLNFTKIQDPFYISSFYINRRINDGYYNNKPLTSDELDLDNYKLITMTQSHSINISLPGTLFDIKLPKGAWFTFNATTELKWDKTVKWYERIDNVNNYISSNYEFYLNKQSLTLSCFMDILKIGINFKAFNFINGYGLVLDNGKIELGYNITEIPLLFNIFKINISPNLIYSFVVKQNNYIENGVFYDLNKLSYSTGNVLTTSLGIDLIIGDGTDYKTTISFKTISENKKMYNYYNSDGLKLFVEDIGKSMNFGNTDDRKRSDYKLKSIQLIIEQGLHDWNLRFTYLGQPEENKILKKFYWENTFSFEVAWQIKTDNQLIKMFKKTDVNSKYEKGEWKQPVLSLDPDNNTATTTPAK